MFSRPIFIYSEYCSHSTNFLNVLIKHPQLYESLIRLNIDVDPQTNSRPQAFYQIQMGLNQLHNTDKIKITQVPTIIIDNGNMMLSDKEAFQWLEHQISSVQKTQKEVEGFNSNEMNSFSDNYADIESNGLNDAKSQNFMFFQNGVLPSDNINTPEESESKATSQNYEKASLQRESFGNTKKQPKELIDFTSTNFGLAGKIRTTKSGGNAKEKDLELRLQTLLNDRD